MDDGSLLSAIIILVLLFFAAYFAVCETAFSSVSRIRLKSVLDRGDKRAEKAMYILDRFDKTIATTLIGSNIVHLGAASYITVLVTRKWGVGAVTLSTVITTVMIFLFGEVLPKTIAKKYSERFSLGTASSLCFFMRIFTPVSALLTAIGSAAAKLTRGDSEVTVTEDELYDIIETMTDDGELDTEQGDLVHSALTFGDVTVESILTARMDVAAIDVSLSAAETVAIIKQQRHSRLPVYEGSIDNIIGIIQIRKYIKAYLSDGDALDLRALLDEAYFIHQSTKIDELLPVMSAKKLNMAVVTDNFGGCLGIVTVEDILEELVGEIWDEDDVIVEPCVKNPDGSFTFDASVDIEDAFEFMDYEDPDGFDFEHKLLAQWAYEQFDLLPKEGDRFTYNGLLITVESMENHRIMKLRVELLPAEEAKDGGDAQ